MVKKYKNLWKDVISEENIADAYQKSIKGKRSYSSVKRFEQDVEGNLKKIRESLINQNIQNISI